MNYLSIDNVVIGGNHIILEIIDNKDKILMQDYKVCDRALGW